MLKQADRWMADQFVFHRDLSPIRELLVAKLSGRPRQTWRSFKGFTRSTVASLPHLPPVASQGSSWLRWDPQSFFHVALIVYVHHA